MNDPKIGLVIGGGNGIGAACCHIMSQRGWRVVVADLDYNAAESVSAEIGASAYGLDVSDLAAVEALADTIKRDVGPVYGLVVASGAFQDLYVPEEFPMELWRRIVSVNQEGTFNTNRVFGSRMARAGEGSIVNVASIVGHASSPQHAYGPTKAAVLSITKNFAAQYGKSGVRVNSVSPGSVLVPRVMARPPGRYAGDIDAQLALGRRIQPKEIAEGVEFLLSTRASAITGIDLMIDAGWEVASSWNMYGGVPGPV